MTRTASRAEDAPVSLVTGCSSGIGRALARELHQRGQRCFATARRPESVAALAEEGLEALRLDVTDPASIRAAFDAVEERAGRLDLLVNNAGQGLFGPLPELPLEQVEALLAANVVGPLAVLQAAVPVMARHGSGRIANVGSVVGVVPTPFAGAYCASKAALHMLSEVLRMEVAPLGIDVIVVQPGAVRSEVADKAPVDLERYRRPGSLYRRVADQIERRSRMSQESPSDTDTFARELADVLARPLLPRTVRLGNGARLAGFLARLPGPWRDRLLARRFGLQGLSERS